MHVLTKAKHVVMNNPTLIDQSAVQGGPTGIDILLDESIPDAALDSSARHPPPQCFPGTREQHIEDITHWALDNSNDHSPQILWMKGPAGVGKSALAQTCAEKIGGKLAAAFFFTRNVRDNPNRFFTTIAYQLATKLEFYRDILDEKIRKDKTLVKKSLARQFQELLVQPFRKLGEEEKKSAGVVIFVDGLDECNDEVAQRELVEIIAASVREQTTPFRWAFFSRAEPHIEATFSKEDIATLCHQMTLPISRDIDGEIELYLRDGFQGILRHHNLRTSTSWPSDEVIRIIVDASAGLFVYAATVLRFVGKPGSIGPEGQLQAILASIAEHHDTRSQHPDTLAHPFAELDAFYILIMRRIPETMLPSIQLLLFVTTLTEGRGAGWCALRLSNVLGFSEVSFRAICNKLHAVLRFQDRQDNPVIDPILDQRMPFPGRDSGNKEERLNELSDYTYGIGGYLSFYHKSFLDFLNDPNRSRNFCIKTPTLANTMFRRCLEAHHNTFTSYRFGVRSWTLAPGILDSASSLSWPHATEYVNSYLKYKMYRTVIGVVLELYLSFDIDNQLLGQLTDLDYREVLGLCYNPSRELDSFGVVILSPVYIRLKDKAIKHLWGKVVHPCTSNAFKLWWVRRHDRPINCAIGHGSKKIFLFWTKDGYVGVASSKQKQKFWRRHEG